MPALTLSEVQTLAYVAAFTAALSAVLMPYVHVVFWRGTTGAIARIEADLQRLRDQLSASETETRRLADGIRQLEEAHRVGSRMPLALPATHSPSAGFDMAIRMAGSGASETELVAVCGLSREEASLMLRLHGGRAREVA